jgi:hypothetical protein
MERVASLQANECFGQQVAQAPISFFACLKQPLFEYTQLTPAQRFNFAVLLLRAAHEQSLHVQRRQVQPAAYYCISVVFTRSTHLTPQPPSARASPAMSCDTPRRTFRVGVGAQRRPQGAIDTQDAGEGHAQQAWQILDGQVLQHGGDDDADLVRDFDNCRCLMTKCFAQCCP